jgi:phage gpG-like protein
MVSETATLDQVIAWLDGIGGGFSSIDFSPALDRCRIAIVSSTKENFAGGHAPDGTPWPALRFPRPGSKGTDRPLRDKGLLAASVTARGAEGNIERRTPTSLEWGSNLDKAGLHQYGGTIRPTKAKALSIPLTREAVRAGSPRNMDNLFRIGRTLVEAKQKGKGKRSFTELVRHYILVDEVKIPARPFLGWNDPLADECGEILAEASAEAIVQSSVTGGGGLRMVA